MRTDTINEPGGALLVNEIFYSLQGEGFNVGSPTVFVRLAQCNLACKFCDTEFNTFTESAQEEVFAEVRKLAGPNALVDITGGEPLLHNFERLVDFLNADGYKVCIETNGTLPLAAWALEKIRWVTVSPKALPKRNIKTGRADEVKWIVNDAFFTHYNLDSDSMYIKGAHNFLQPQDNDPRWIAAATKLALRHPDRYRLSVQVHKLTGTP